MNDIQNILDNAFPFVKKLLEEYGEFYPFACGINSNNKFENIVLEEDEENDNPNSKSVIGELKKEIEWNKEKFVAVAIFYDVKLDKEKTDAVAVLVEQKIEKHSYTFYFSYNLIEKEMVIIDSWKTEKEFEFFKSQPSSS